MRTFLVMTVIADDKPGLVESLSEAIARHQGNWLESSMAQLAGKFAGILKISVSTESADQLAAALQALESNGLKLVIEKVEEGAVKASSETALLTLVANDHPGIIRDISRVILQQGGNVEHLVSECVPAPMSGDMLFKARIQLAIPSSVKLEKVQRALEKLADDLIVEMSLTQDQN